MKFIELTKKQYDDFARNHPYHNFLNSAQAFEMKASNGWQYAFVGVEEQGEMIAATGLVFVPVMRKFFYAYAQRGFLLDYQDAKLLAFFTKELVQYLKPKNVLYIKADPYVLYQERDNDGNIVTDGFKHEYVIKNMSEVGFVHQGFTTGFDEDSQCRFMMTLYLDGKDAEQVLKEMDQQTRWSVNKTRKLGVKVREITLDELDVFDAIMAFTSEKKHIHNMGKAYYQRQMETFGKENLKLMVAYLDIEDFKATIAADKVRESAALEEIEAVLKEMPNSKKFIKKKRVQLEALELIEKREKEALDLEKRYGKEAVMAASSFVFYGEEVTYLTSGAYDEFRKYNAPYAIQWVMIQEAIQRGIKRYNFYGTSGVFDESADDYGVFEFKKGFNAVAEELVGDFICPVNSMKYKAYRLVQKLRK